MRILLVEDDGMIGEALSVALRDAAYAVDWVKDGGAASRALEHGEHQAMLLDLGLPDGSGIDIIRETAARYPDCDIMVVSVFGDEDHVLASIEAGAAGYVLKQVGSDDLVRAVRAIGQGDAVLDPTITRKVLNRVRLAEREAQFVDAFGRNTDGSPALPQLIRNIVGLQPGDDRTGSLGVHVGNQQRVLGYVDPVGKRVQAREGHVLGANHERDKVVRQTTDAEQDGRQRYPTVHAQEGVVGSGPVSYTHLRAHETVLDLVCRLLLEKKKIYHINR